MMLSDYHAERDFWSAERTKKKPRLLPDAEALNLTVRLLGQTTKPSWYSTMGLISCQQLPVSAIFCR